MNDAQPYGQLLDNATTLWAEGKGWFLGKWATVAVLRQAARDPAYYAAVAAKVAPAGIGAGAPPTLRILITIAFDVAILVYGPRLPFGGAAVRAVRDYVLEHLDQLFVPMGLAYQAG